MDIIHATFVGALSGVLGTGAGGLLILLVNFGAGAGLSFLLAASGGIMISISLMELIPEAVEVGSKGWAALGLLLGVIILFVLDMVLPHAHSSLVVRAKSGVYHGERAARLRSAGLLIGLGIALHNLPEGLAIGAAYAHQQSLGLGVALIIALHNIPEGMAMAVPLRAGGMGRGSVVLSTMLAGLPLGVGAFLGAWVGQVSPTVLSVCLGFAAGAMMYVVSDELIPEAHFCARGEYPTIGLVAGILLGVLLTLVL
ncbi:MAG: ZIP family metal transporter [Bacillota bacterium]|nr:ZIP family metal transporter [Candidatus Fermentithermobacillaceae bacterium]